MKNDEKIYAFIFFVFLYSFSSFGQKKANDTLVVSGINRVNLANYLTFWVDSSKAADIKKVESNFVAKKFKNWQANNTLNFGKNPYLLWFHLTIKSNSNKYKDYWWAIYTRADTITVFKKNNTSFKSVDTLFKSTLLDHKKVKTRFPAIKIELDAFETQE